MALDEPFGVRELPCYFVDMGIAASVHHQRIPDAEELIAISPDNDLLTELSARKYEGKIMDNFSIVVCTTTWEFIRSYCGLRNFANRFFHFFESSYPAVCRLLHPHYYSREAGNTRVSLLVHIIGYTLGTDNHTKENKKKLRALGRRHVLSGITLQHFHIFAQVFIQSLLSYKLTVFKEQDIVKSWLCVLSCITEEMFCEKIVLVSHHSISQASDEIAKYSSKTPVSENPGDESTMRNSGPVVSGSYDVLRVIDME